MLGYNDNILIRVFFDKNTHTVLASYRLNFEQTADLYRLRVD